MKKTKSLIFTFILFLVIMSATVYYAYTSDIQNVINKYIILGGFLIEIILIFILHKISSKNKKLAIEAYEPIRNVKISKSSEIILINNKEENSSMENEVNNSENYSDNKNKVVLLHIDTVNKNNIKIRLFKEQVAILDVIQEINKN